MPNASCDADAISQAPERESKQPSPKHHHREWSHIDSVDIDFGVSHNTLTHD
jgi:hypothetical protein